MPNCMRCGEAVPRRSDLTLVRGESGRWEIVCHKCNDTSPESADEGGSVAAVPASPGEAFQRLRGILQTLLEEREIESPRRAYERQHQRQPADLQLEFTLLRDDAVHEGRVHDLSRGGVRFSTSRELSKGNIINLVVTGTSDETPLIRSAAEVRRVTFTDDGMYDVGARFVKRSLTHEDNRRRFRRYDADMVVYYQREGADSTCRGDVCDVSQGGTRVVVDEAIEKDEEFSVILRGEGGRFCKADLVGKARCLRVKQLNAREWEIGCSFRKVSAVPRSTSAKATAESSDEQ